MRCRVGQVVPLRLPVLLTLSHSQFRARPPSRRPFGAESRVSISNFGADIKDAITISEEITERGQGTHAELQQSRDEGGGEEGTGNLARGVKLFQSGNGVRKAWLQSFFDTDMREVVECGVIL